MNKVTAMLVFTVIIAGQANADSFEAEVKPMLEASCLLCHGEGTVTPLNMQELSYDLSDAEVYRTWEHIYNRIERGQMPPMEVTDTVRSLIDDALAAIKPALTDANIAARGAHGQLCADSLSSSMPIPCKTFCILMRRLRGRWLRITRRVRYGWF